MALNKKIISQFAKVTKKQNDKSNKESTIYATIDHYDENTKECWVRFDGANTLTRVTRFTSVVNPDERVTVMIKNHTAIITGNLKSPSASTIYVNNTVNDTVDAKFNELGSIDEEFINNLWITEEGTE